MSSSPYSAAQDQIRSGYIYNTGDNARLASTIAGFSGIDFARLPSDKKALIAMMTGMLTTATSGLTGFDSTQRAANKFDTLAGAFTAAGPISLTGAVPTIGGGYKYYGRTSGPSGNVQLGGVQSMLKYVDSNYSGKDQDLAAHLLSDKIRSGGMDPEMIKNLDMGNGTNSDVYHRVNAAKRAGTISEEDYKQFDKGYQAKQRLDKRAYNMLKEAGVDVGEFDSNRNYFNSAAFTHKDSKTGVSLRDKLMKEVQEKGGLFDSGGKVRLAEMEDVNMATLMASGSGSAIVANASKMKEALASMQDSFDALKEVQDSMGISSKEMESFAKQTGMGAISNKKTAQRIREWTVKTKELAAESGRDLKEVAADQQSIADAMSGTGVTVTMDKVLTATRQRNNIMQDDARGGSIYTAEERTTKAVRTNERASFENRGLYLARAILNNPNMSEEAKAKAQALIDKFKSGNMSFSEMNAANADAMRLASDNGIDTTNEAVMRDVEKRYAESGDVEAIERTALQNNMYNYAKGKRGKAVQKAFGGGKKGAEQAADVMMAIFDAVGQDDSEQSGGAKLKERAQKLRTMSGDERTSYLSGLKANGATKYDIEAIEKLAGLSDEQMNSVMSLYYGTAKHGDTALATQTGNQKLAAKEAYAAKTMSDLAAQSKGWQTNKAATGDSMIAQFAAGIMGTQDITNEDMGKMLYARVQELKGRAKASGTSDETLASMSTAQILNAGAAESGSSVRYGDQNFMEFENAFGEDGTLTQATKDKIMADSRFQKYAKEHGMDFASMKDGDFINLMENAVNGKVSATDNGLFLATGTGLANAQKEMADLRNKHGELFDAFGGVEAASEFVKLGSNGNITALGGATWHNGSKTLDRSAPISVEDLWGMDDATIKTKFGQFVDPETGKKRDVTREDIFGSYATNENHAIREDFVKTYGRQLRDMKGEETSAGETKLPGWLEDNLTKMREGTESMNKQLSSIVSQEGRVKVTPK